ncbi:hypothetical protein EX217_10885 [Providencia rettgeri]|uniref:hypothetical protein n=1 Tax=Providencia rettgeri TaxID=587 RepID=UPI001C8349E7|nr:hypothetical protein [Providencia rettgeri]MBX6968251.1 hypothetical protein [Providencia rettgeri]MBX6978004.1 hypothetical protein [Providencia rettgeri]MBX6994981.1 hypothetical protein [Providencia rettgeri]MBX6996116.1 hypothetical protein [Providencia rettgeri]MBX7023712.1 hypothetical protein [Providencia rettgeri]
MAENGPIEDLAKRVSHDIFSRFKWEQRGPCDQDFICDNEDKHKPLDKKQKHTHPVDVVFSYKDPYLNKIIYLNTDLKSYSKGSINTSQIESTLASLAKTIECAKYSAEWSEKYNFSQIDHEIRGLLFVFNHDNQLQHNFYDFFNPPKPAKGRRSKAVNLEKVPLCEEQQIHIIDPFLINYMLTITNDMNDMIARKEFPDEEYGFVYPQLTFHKVTVTEKYLPATIEVLSAPFMIVKHGAVYKYNRDSKIEEVVYPEGYVVYYNQKGNSDNEFFYLLDLLSNYQILNGLNKIRIRLAYHEKTERILSHFHRGIEKYAHEYGLDEEAKRKLEDIDVKVLSSVKEFFSAEVISWEQ